MEQIEHTVILGILDEDQWLSLLFWAFVMIVGGGVGCRMGPMFLESLVSFFPGDVEWSEEDLSRGGIGAVYSMIGGCCGTVLVQLIRSWGEDDFLSASAGWLAAGAFGGALAGAIVCWLAIRRGTPGGPDSETGTTGAAALDSVDESSVTEEDDSSPAEAQEPEEENVALPHGDPPSVEEQQGEGQQDEEGGKEEPAPESGVSAYCRKCKEHYEVESMDSLVAGECAEDVKPACPSCNRANEVPTCEIVCEACGRGLWASLQLLDRAIACPHCEATFSLPSRERWRELEADAEQFRWIVTPEGGASIKFEGRNEPVSAMKLGQVGPSDRCKIHGLAPKKKLKEVCDEMPKLRELYDPIGVACGKAARGAALASIFISVPVALVWLVGFSPWQAHIMLGAFAVALIPTVIGPFIALGIGWYAGVNPLAVCLAVVLLALAIGAVMLAAYGLTYGLVYAVLEFRGVGRKRVVDWG